MKIRNGFVSNSSTSSFIIIGKKTSLDWDLLEEKYPAFNKFDDKDKRIMFENDGSMFIGVLLGESTDGYMESSEYDYLTITKLMESLSRELEMIPELIKLYVGERSR